MGMKIPRPLFPPTYRLFLFCVAVGLLGAAVAVVFDSLVQGAQGGLLQGLGGMDLPEAGTLTPDFHIPPAGSRWWLPVVTTLGGLLGGILVYGLAPETEGHGTDAAIAAYHQRAGQVRLRVPFVKALASALTLGSGGVAGREGPAAQINSGLGNWLAEKAGLRGEERRILALASMSAGLAAIFRAPLGMALFSVEVLYSGMVFESEALVFTILSAVTAYATHGWISGWTPIFATPAGLRFHHPESLLGYAFLGVLAGVAGALLPLLFYRIQDLFRRLPLSRFLKPALGGLAVGLLALAVPEVLGTGYGWVELALAGNLPLSMLLLLLLLKPVAMSLTVGSGASGGVFGPTVVVGAMLGGSVGGVLQHGFPLLHPDPAAFALVGMAAIFAACARTPISTLILVVEMTGGYGLIVPVMLTNVLAFVVQRSLTRGWSHPTLYSSQVESREDSPVHRGAFVRRALQWIEEGTLEVSGLSLPRLVSLLQFGEAIPIAGADGLLVSVRIQPGSKLDGSSVAEALGSIQGATAVAVLRGNQMLVPRGPTLLRAGDQLVAVARPETAPRLRQIAGEVATANEKP